MHNSFMHRCLTLAEKGRGKTGINPMVGAVLVRDGKIIAEGLHEGFAKPHAEAQLMEKYVQKISSSDILYVSLEPCCHIHKKTPPCAQILIQKGVKNIVIGMQDPNPEVAGKGIELLRSNGVTVTIASSMTADCLRLNRGFTSLMTKQRPWITVKSAVTADGRIANADDSRLMITSPEQDAWSHEFLRARHDAILVGVGTVIADDPQLTVRFPVLTPACPAGKPVPSPIGRGVTRAEPRGGVRVILDPHLRIPLDARVVRQGTIVVASSPDQRKMKDLEKKGVRILDIPSKKSMFDWPSLWKALITPSDDFYGISSILVEGGQKTWNVFREAGMVDEEVTLVGK